MPSHQWVGAPDNGKYVFLGKWMRTSYKGQNHETLRRNDFLPCETIPPSPSLLSRSIATAPTECQHGRFLRSAHIQLTLYRLRTRSTVVSLGSNLRTCFKSAGPSTASSRAQSMSDLLHSSGRVDAQYSRTHPDGTLKSVDREGRAAARSQLGFSTCLTLHNRGAQCR